MSPDEAEGFAILDLDNGAGWELLRTLITFKPSDRWGQAPGPRRTVFVGASRGRRGGLAERLLPSRTP